MNILEHLNKNNLHHAYLLEGERDEILGEVLEFIKSLGIKVTGNADICHISLDSFKIEDARNLKSYAMERGFFPAQPAQTGKKIFIISANSFLLEAQNSLLKMFEEPIENTHFFIIMPDANILLKTLASRCYFISTKQDLVPEAKDAEKFIAMSLKNRIGFIKELLAEPEEEDEQGNEVVILDSTRSKALKFLNTLEIVLHKKAMSRMPLDTNVDFFEHFFKVREFLRQPGSSTKTLMESAALAIPTHLD